MRLGVTSRPLWGADLPTPRPTRLPQDNHRLGSPTFLCPRFTRLARVVQVPPDPEGSDIPLALWVDVLRAIRGTGISTGCASTTPLGLALAPDLPWED